MNPLLKTIRNSLCKFSGEDYAIIQISKTRIQIYFSLIGLFVLAILACCFVSALSFTEHLFHNIIADVGVGIIWGYIITNLYVLLLYTITPPLLPSRSRGKDIKTGVFKLSASMVVRIGLVILLAIITAQPLNIFILKPGSVAFANDIRGLLAHNFWAWVTTILVVFVFLLPIYLKYNITKFGEFYEKKSEIERRIIEDDYKDFKQDYKRILGINISKYNQLVWGNLMPYLNRLEKVNPLSFQHHYGEIDKELTREEIEKYEYWANPPYRTAQKSQLKKLLSEQDLLKHIYPETD